MKKSKALKLAESDFNSIYETVLYFNVSIYSNYALFNDPCRSMQEDEYAVFNRLKTFTKNNNFYNLLLVNLVSVMENYLRNFAIELVENDKELISVFIKNYKFERNFSKEDIINGSEKVVLDTINGLIFHNLHKVNVIFKIIAQLDILQIENIEISELFSIIKFRHIVVHQSNSHNGEKFILTTDTLLQFFNLISKWITQIDSLILNDKFRKRPLNYKYRFWNEISKITKSQILKDGHKQLLNDSMEIFSNYTSNHPEIKNRI